MFLRRRRSQRDFEEEIRAHLAIEAERLVEEGMSLEEARYAAQRRFGNVGVTQERVNDGRGGVWFEDFLKDVRYAIRMLRNAPGFTTVAVLTLALGIGANTAVFSVINGVLLRSLPYREPARLVRLWETLPGLSQVMLSYPDYVDWRRRTRVFDDIAIYNPFSSMSMTGVDLPEVVGIALASANLFDVLGIAPEIGRGIRADEDRPGAARVAVLSEGWWRRRFGADRSMVGKRLTLDGEMYTVVGVIPPLPGIKAVDVWIPLGLRSATDTYNRENHPGLIGVGRLKSGITLDQMKSDLERVSSQLRAEYPTEDAGIGGGGDFLGELMVRNVRSALRMLAWSVGLVLLIACVNVANLLLGRSTSRRKEIALRTALGATQGRIMRLLLVENMILAISGGVCGVALAYVSLRAIVALRPTTLPRLTELQIDLRVLFFAAVVSIVTGLVFGLMPARQTLKVDLNDALKESARGSSAGGSALRLRGLLMTVEVAMAMMLLIGAGLLIRSFVRLANVDPGVDPRGVTIGWLSLPSGTYGGEDAQRHAMNEILRRVRALPGVTSAALTSALPLGANMQHKITFQGHPRPKGKEPLINVDIVTPDYFTTVRMRVVAGRGIASTDVTGGPLVAVISESVAREHFPGEDPIGKRIVHGPFDATEPWLTVVGVVSDVKEQSLDTRSVGTIYMPFDQQPMSWSAMAVRSSLPAEGIMPEVRRVVAEFDHSLPIGNQGSLERVIDESLGQERFMMFTIGIFAIVALILAAVGVYGVIAYFVSQRSHEIGIRMALGAQRSDIVSLIGGGIAMNTAVGIAIGVAGAIGASSVMTNLLYEIQAVDAKTYVVGAVTLIGAALVAAAVPTLRATRVNPARTIRAD